MDRKRYGDPWDFRYKLSQISRVMKMVFFMMLLSLTHLSASVKSQNSVVNLTLKNVSVEQALTKTVETEFFLQSRECGFGTEGRFAVV